MSRYMMVVDFNTYEPNDMCIIWSKGKKIKKNRHEFMDDIAQARIEHAIRIKSRWQLLHELRYTFLDVYKYIVVFPDGAKILIKNVTDDDEYFEQLEAFSKYKLGILYKDGEVYPSIPERNNWDFDDGKKKRT